MVHFTLFLGKCFNKKREIFTLTLMFNFFIHIGPIDFDSSFPNYVDDHKLFTPLLLVYDEDFYTKSQKLHKKQERE